VTRRVFVLARWSVVAWVLAAGALRVIASPNPSAFATATSIATAIATTTETPPAGATAPQWAPPPSLADLDLPTGDLRDDPRGRAWLEHYIGGTNWVSEGADGIRVYANPTWQADAERAARAAEQALPSIDTALGLEPRAILPFWILIVPRAEGYAKEAPTWSAAVAQPDRRLIVISGPAVRRTALDLEETVAHEIAHLAIRARIGELGWIPRWLDEGLAMWLSGYSSWRDRLALAGRGPVDLRDLTDRFPVEESLARQAYIESETAVRRLEERGPIAPLLDRIAAGEDFEPAFQEVYGESFDAFADAVAEEVPAFWRVVAVLRGTALLWVFAALLVVLGAWRIRLRNRRRMREWDAADARRPVDAMVEEGDSAVVPTDSTGDSTPDAGIDPTPREPQSR
jgi:Peptidase MA superfamily